MSTNEARIEELIRAEGLDDMDALLVPREWDEVPLVSRFERIAFLDGANAWEKSRILVLGAVRHLDRVITFAAGQNRDDVVIMVSIVDWANLHSAEGDPVIPNFWITTNPMRDLTRFRLRPCSSQEGSLVSEWLRTADLHETHEVFDAVEPAADPELLRIYVAQRGCPKVAPLVLR